MHTAAESHLSSVCPLMRRLIKTHGPCTLEIAERSPWEALVSAIAHQQLNGKAAMSILKLVEYLIKEGHSELYDFICPKFVQLFYVFLFVHINLEN